MKNRFALISVLFASIAESASAFAHDPALHAESEVKEAPKAKPATCEQLADRTKFKVDLGDPQTKALKDRCDAQAQSAAKKK